MKSVFIGAVLLISFLGNPAHSETLQQCQAQLSELNQITQLAREQIDELQKIRKKKDQIIKTHKLKISNLEKRIALLQKGDVISKEMLTLLEENQDLCLATEIQAYALMQKIMTDYKEAVEKATRPWFLRPSFYGGLLLGALAVAAF